MAHQRAKVKRKAAAESVAGLPGRAAGVVGRSAAVGRVAKDRATSGAVVGRGGAAGVVGRSAAVGRGAKDRATGGAVVGRGGTVGRSAAARPARGVAVGRGAAVRGAAARPARGATTSAVAARWPTKSQAAATGSMAAMRKADRLYNVAQQQKTRERIGVARGKTKEHITKLRAGGASAAQIKKARSKAQDRYTKIKGRQKTRMTMA